MIIFCKNVIFIVVELHFALYKKQIENNEKEISKLTSDLNLEQQNNEKKVKELSQKYEKEIQDLKDKQNEISNKQGLHDDVKRSLEEAIVNSKREIDEYKLNCFKIPIYDEINYN